MKTLGWQTHTCLLITGGAGGGDIIFPGVLGCVFNRESREIEIRVCFCSDMDEELRSTDQSTDREREKSGGE